MPTNTNSPAPISAMTLSRTRTSARKTRCNNAINQQPPTHQYDKYKEISLAFSHWVRSMGIVELYPRFSRYFRHKVGVNNTNIVKTSRRPSSMAMEHTQV